MSKLPVFNPELDIQIERVVDLPRSKIFEAWTNPNLLPVWFCPPPWKVTECSIDLRPGGNFYTLMVGPNGEGGPMHGCYLEVIKDEKLVWTDALLADFRPSEKSFMTAMIVLEDHPQGTKYTARAMHKNAADRLSHIEMGFEQGWNLVLDQLVTLMKNK